ncbi:hypothetical protein P4V54_09235 [Brevibacillus nitrificans]|uniref:hypothetical protein n=1 Tax=Brevibacillus nitrificans TaxID=651560 RepID=UPI002E1E42BE|nr:hypothetical protein [Brevibacillus nitrificans]
MEDIKKVLDRILNYWLLFPVLIYLTGFIYVQGILSFVSFKFLSLDSFGITASTELYIKNGIFFWVWIIVPLVLAVVIFYILKPRIKQRKYHAGYMPLLLISQSIGWYFHFLVSERCNNKLISFKTYEMFNIIYSGIYYTISLTVFIIGFYLISVLTKEEKNAGFLNTNSENKEYRESKTSYYLYHVLLMAISIIISIFFSGIFKQDLLVQSAINSSGGKITYADVVTEDINKRYLYFDLVSNYFIGFDMNYSNTSSSSVIIPLAKVKKIDVVELSSPEKVRMISNDQSVQARKKVIDNYYNSFKNRDASSFITTISRKMYREHPYTLIPVDELQKIWNQSKDSTHFVPSYYQVFESNESKQKESTLYVIEYYNSGNKYLEYRFTYEDNLFKIDKISEVKQSFNIQE